LYVLSSVIPDKEEIMHTKTHARLSTFKRLAAVILGSSALFTALPANTYGDPPPWAPAHGWRKKNDPYYVGYTGRKWDRDYGIVSGRCNREAVGAVLGGVTGGAIGSQVGKGSGRDIAILVGTVAGAIIGAQIGRDMDQTDRACMGHALELAAANKRVSWTGADRNTTYLLTPHDGFRQNGRQCREFTLTTTSGGRQHDGRGKACQTADGTWQVVG
jgi:surface antigen